MIKMKTYTLQFDNELQMKIFFLLLNNPNDLTRNEIMSRLGFNKRTTVIDNITKLRKRKLEIDSDFRNGTYEYHYSLPYIVKRKRLLGLHKRGRPNTIFFIANKIISTLMFAQILLKN